MIVRVNVVLNKTVVADSDWRFDNQCKSTGTVRYVLLQTRGARDGAVVRALASHQCGLGSNPGVDAICGLSLLLILSFAPRGFSPGTPVFPSPQKPTFPDSNSTRDQVDEEPLCGCATSKSLFIIIYLFTDYYQRLTLESSFINLEQNPLNRSQQLPAPYKRLVDKRTTGQLTMWLTINDCLTVTIDGTKLNAPITLRVFIANNITA